ncbi:MBL fold metallo-hydrolase [Actinacidiphila rubida]|uniref:Glyoxylase, beta-lactamase superfamily II n=1 Tax=Actinacidiphila rubida TaxID=310780 RepID=A0A1H8TT09_9ACTN|nr:MBL fold metallo-hydrolase [Actinacidiphila rubida]SEO93976.1 Glyoxylase, beta-lactamase superfamily II [Actinacidiphila rubida]
MDVEIVSTEGLGDRTYIVHNGHVAIVVDPQRDIDRVEKLVADLGLTLAAVAETHIHNDYVTGGLALAQRSGARYLVSADDTVSFNRVPVNDGDEMIFGSLHMRALKTPGHTPHHLSYVIRDARRPDQSPAVFTGGSLLYGSVGRTDLVDPAQTLKLTGLQYQSVRRLGDALPDDTSVFPTHGFGSFCSAGETAPDDNSTIGREKIRNDVYTAADEQSFIEKLLGNITPYPAYYAHMAPLNLAGPALPDLSSPEPVSPAELRRRLQEGEWLVDIRSRKAFAANHIDGSVSIELGEQSAIYLGWILPWGSPITLIGESPSDVAAMQRQLARIGIDHLAGATAGPFDQITSGLGHGSYLRVDFAHVPATLGDDDVILDVRRVDERVRGHIPGSLHIPLTEILDRIDELPRARLWVHCGSGFRAGIAASLLDRALRPVVHIDDFFANAANRARDVS